MARLATRLAQRLSAPLAKRLSSSAAAVEALVGLSNFSAANYMQTAAGGGEAGVATGCGLVTVWRPRAQLSQGQAGIVLNRMNAGSIRGHQHHVGSWASGMIPVATYGRGDTYISLVGTLASRPPEYGRIRVTLSRITPMPGLIELMLDGAWEPSTTALSAFVPADASTPTILGNDASNNSLWFADVLGVLTFRGNPTRAQCEALVMAVRTRGDVPDTMDGAVITHRWSLRDELRGTVVVDGQTAPAQLTDTITRAPVDALARQGSPVVRVIDPSADGRRTLGAQGFSPSSYLQTANPSATPGSASGVVVAAVVRVDQLPGTTTQLFVGRSNYGGQGWIFQTTGTPNVIRFYVSNSVGGVLVGSASYTLTAGDVGQTLLFVGVYTGLVLQLWVRRAPVGADVSTTGFTPFAGPTLVGYTAAPALTPLTIFSAACGQGVAPTPSQIQAAFDEFERTQRMPALAGLDHIWELTADILASGVDAVPAVVLDRVGTDNLTRVGFGVQTSGGSFVGIGPYVLNTCYGKTQVGGGIQGSATMHVVVDVWFTRIPTASEAIVSCQWNGGWTIAATAAGKLAIELGGVGTIEYHTLTPGDLNRTLRIVLNLRDAAGAELWVDGVLRGTWAGRNYVTETVAAMTVGQRFAGTGALTSGYVKLVQGGSAASLTPAEIATDPTQPPPVIAGKTQKRYLFELDAASSSGAVPGRCIERISGNDDLIMSGNGLVLAQRTERLWSYEATPIAHGVKDLSAANYYTVPGGLSGTPMALSVDLWIRVDSQQVASATRVLLGKRDNGFPGWHFATSGTNSTLVFALGHASAAAASPTALIAAADVGKVLHVKGVWDGTRIHLYIKRVEQGTGTVFGGYVASSVACTLGRRSDGYGADGITVLAWGGAEAAVHSLAEYQAQCDAFLATDQAAIVPGKYDHLWRVDGNTSAQLTDVIGTEHMTRQGNPTLAPIFARAAGW